MRKLICMQSAAIPALFAYLPIACRESNATPSKQTITELNLKRGALISCGNTVLQSNLPKLDWQKFPWQHAIIHYTRLLGSVHTNDLPAANVELKALQAAHDTLLSQKDSYKANQVLIQLKAGEAWIRFKEGKNKEALELMRAAADLEDKTEKHPVTPGEVIPAKELLGDLLLAMHRPAEALVAYEASLQKHPNRLNGIKGVEYVKSITKQVLK